MNLELLTVSREPINRFNLFLFLFFAALSIVGCASKWALVVESPADPAQWRDDTNALRVRYLQTVTGFKETGTTVSNVLRYIAFGNRESDNTIIRPVSAAIGRDKRMAIADLGRSCVHLYVPSEQKYRRIYSAGKVDLRTPVSVVFDDDLRLYVSDSSRGAIYIFDRDGAYLISIERAGDDVLQRPTGLSYLPGKKILYAVDTLANKVFAFNTSGTLLFSLGGPGEQQGQFNFPTHIATSPDERLYVTDAMNFRVQIFDSSGAYLSSFGHHGNGSGDFSMPKGIVVDKSGVIYVVDALFDNVQLFNMTGGFLLTIGGRGTGLGEFWLPSGLFLDNQDKLYVCDTFNQRIQVFQMMGAPQ
jgi:DNA-binding beta-propeller fold protein YncE